MTQEELAKYATTVNAFELFGIADGNDLVSVNHEGMMLTAIFATEADATKALPKLRRPWLPGLRVVPIDLSFPEIDE